MAGFALGLVGDRTWGTRFLRVVGIFLGLGAGFWAAGKQLRRFTRNKTR